MVEYSYKERDAIHRLVCNTMRSAAWERAKAALYEMIAIEGSKNANSGDTDSKYDKLKEYVEAFVTEIESEELHL